MRKFLTQKRVWVPAIVLILAVGTALGLSARASSATTFHTMRPSGNTLYCVNDQVGAGGYLSLTKPCPGGDPSLWGVEPSSWNAGWVQIQNAATGLCMETMGGGIKLGVGNCNGEQAQAWLELPGNNDAGWESAENDQAHGIAYCADANATYGIRAEDCNGTGAQVWDGPE